MVHRMTIPIVITLGALPMVCCQSQGLFGQQVASPPGGEHLLTPVRTTNVRSQYGAYALALSPDRTRLLVGQSFPLLSLLNADDLTPVPGAEVELPTVSEGVTTVSYTPDGRHVLAGGGKGVLRLFTSDKLTLVRVLNDDQDDQLQARVSPDGTLVATASWYLDKLRLRKIQDGTELWHADIDELVDARFSPDGTMLYVSGANLSVWSVESGERKETVSEQLTGMMGLSSDGRFLAATHPEVPIDEENPQASVIIWDTTTWKPVRTIHGGPSLSLVFTEVEDTLYLFAGTHGGKVMVANIASGKTYVQRVIHDGDATSIVVDRDNDLVFTTGMNNNHEDVNKIQQWSLSAWIEHVK